MPQASVSTGEAPSAPGRPSRRVALVLGVAAVVVAAGVLVYALTLPPPIPLTVRDGSGTGTVSGNFTSILQGSSPYLVEQFDATTVASQGGAADSRLSLHLDVLGYFQPILGSAPLDGTWCMGVVMSVTGSFAPNLRPQALSFTANATGTGHSVVSLALPTDSEVNASGPADSGAWFRDTGSLTVTAGLVNQSGSGTTYAFRFAWGWDINEWRDYNATYGFRAAVTGPFTPAVSVGLLLNVINLPATNPTPPIVIGAAITVSPEGTDWFVTLTSVPANVSDRTTYLKVLDPSGGLIIWSTPFGSLNTAPYGGTITYLAADAASGNLAVGDRIILTRATYPAGDQVQFIRDGAVVFSATLQ